MKALRKDRNMTFNLYRVGSGEPYPDWFRNYYDLDVPDGAPLKVWDKEYQEYRELKEGEWIVEGPYGDLEILDDSDIAQVFEFVEE